MFLEKLSLINFKNIEHSMLELSPGVNCFVGDNGAGKTNILDAIHYLSMCKSSLTMTDRQCLRHGEEFFVLEGDYRCDSEHYEKIFCGFKPVGGKTLKRNGKEYEKLSEHIGLAPLVIVSPSDSFLISDAADERRRYLNAFLSQLDREYLGAIMRYNHILSERNRLLKIAASGDDLMSVLDEQLCTWGEKVHQKRAELVKTLAPIVAGFYATLSGDKEQVELTYKSELSECSMIDLLRDAREKDRINQFTTSGVHRDDMKMKIGGHTLKKYGSQGQQKSFLIALKLAQYVIVSKAKSEKPLLLLDDLFDKLDMQRVEQLLSLVSGDDFGQIFITDCNKNRLEWILEQSSTPYSLWNVSDGKIVKQ